MIGRQLIRWLCVFALGCVIIQRPTAAAEFDQTHAVFSNVLTRYVKDARVDYAALKAHPEELNTYLDQLASVSEAEFKSWPEKQQIAFLINAYNAYTLKLIIDRYPVKSIRDIGWLLKGPWDQEMVRLFGKTTTLGTVEHKILRVKYAEPRIHFAIVCAALGCPPLRSEPYTAEKLDAQLDDQGRKFFSQKENNSVDVAARVIYLSPIFKWFSGDFEKKSGSVLKFVEPYFPESVQPELRKGGFRIKYTDYDWSLNEQQK